MFLEGIRFRLGLSVGTDILLAGPSNYGLADPAHSVALSVLQATVPMLNTKTNIDSIVMGKIMTRYVDDIGAAFIKVHRHMDEQNTAEQENFDE